MSIRDIALIALLVMVVGCGADRRGIGAACRHANDCIEGAACNYMTCDFVEPCSVRETDGDGDSTVKTYRFDEDGRPLGWEDRDGEEVVGKEVWTWSSDHREARVESWLTDPSKPKPDLVTILQFDGDDLLERRRQEFDSGSESATYTWSESWSCRAPRIVSHDGEGSVRYRTRASCDDDGVVQRIDHLIGDEVAYSVEYVYERERVVERVAKYEGPDTPPDHRMRFHRDVRGSVVKIEMDMELDGTIDQTMAFDLSCWEVDGDRVRLR